MLKLVDVPFGRPESNMSPISSAVVFTPPDEFRVQVIMSVWHIERSTGDIRLIPTTRLNMVPMQVPTAVTARCASVFKDPTRLID